MNKAYAIMATTALDGDVDTVVVSVSLSREGVLAELRRAYDAAREEAAEDMALDYEAEEIPGIVEREFQWFNGLSEQGFQFPYFKHVIDEDTDHTTWEIVEVPLHA